MLQGDRLLTLVPYGVVRQLVEARQLALIDTAPALPFTPLGVLMQDTGTTLATARFVSFLEQFVRSPT
jgi:hypothetical protein